MDNIQNFDNYRKLSPEHFRKCAIKVAYEEYVCVGSVLIIYSCNCVWLGCVSLFRKYFVPLVFGFARRQGIQVMRICIRAHMRTGKTVAVTCSEGFPQAIAGKNE
jgi:hypothetical protein